MTSTRRVFDGKHYESLNQSRAAIVSQLVSELARPMNMQTAVDVGCGLGFFAALLHSLGLKVTAVDGRKENIEEASRRSPQVSFHVVNAEDAALRDLGRFDLVLCFGLLYHLENPFLAIRHLHAVTSGLLLAESVIFPGAEPMMGLVDEGPTEDQGLNHIAFYPTEACLVKLMYRAGFAHVYKIVKMPDHPDFRSTPKLRRVRTMLAASHAPLQSSLLGRASEPRMPIEPWDARSGSKPSVLDRLRSFAGRSLPGETNSLKRRFGAR